MNIFSRKFEAQLAAIPEPGPVPVMAEPSHESIRRTKVKMPGALAFKDILDKAESVLGYRCGRGYKLDQCLAELGLETLNGDDVRKYMAAKTRHPYGFVQYPLKDYRLPIPIHVLETAIRIKEKLPTAEFTVYNYELNKSAAGDPFLWVSQDGWGNFIEVWDEPEFEGRKTI